MAHDWEGCSFVIVPFDDLKEVDPQNFEDRNEMLSVGPVVEEAVEELHTVGIVSSDILKLLRLFTIVGLEGIKPLFLHPVRRALI